MAGNPYIAAANAAAAKYGIPPSLFRSLINYESGWNATIRSSAGALGLTQLMPDTARSLGVDPLDPLANLDGGARYLKQQFDKFGSWRLALAAYNAGPGAVQQYGGIPPYPQTENYVTNVLAQAALKNGAVTRTNVALAGNGDAALGGSLPLPTLPTAPLLTAPPSLESAVLRNLQETARGRPPSPEEQLSRLTQAVVTAGSAPTVTSAISPQAPASAGASSFKGAFSTQGLKYVAAASGVDLKNVNHDLLTSLNALGQALGGPVTVTSGYRSAKEQYQIYQEFKAGKRAGPVAAAYYDPKTGQYTSTSNHTRGLALDVYVNGVAIGKAVPASLLAKYGLRARTDIDDAPHVEFIGGSH